jgi:nitrate/nitrite transporter NarK
MALSAVMIFSGLPDLWRYLGCIALSLWGGMLPGAVMASVPVLAPSPQQIGAVNGFAVQGANLGLLLGPPAAGAVVALSGDWNDLLLLFLVASSAVMVAGACLARLEARTTRGPRPPHR